MKVKLTNGETYLDFESHTEYDEFVSAVTNDFLHEEHTNKKLDKFISRLLKIQKNIKNDSPPFLKIVDDEIATLNSMLSRYKTQPFLDILNNSK